jgi:integrase
MATIRKRGTKWQVQVRRAGHGPISKSFTSRKDAIFWSRQAENLADRGELPANPQILKCTTLGDLVRRYLETVTPHKRAADNERISLNAFLRHRICARRLSDLSTKDFAVFRDERLKAIKPISLKRQLDPVHNLLVIARHEWGIPIRDNPLDRLKLKAPSQKRERRLRSGEFELLIEACQLCRNPYIELIIRLAIETGMRRGEILSIKREDVDLGRRTLLIPRTKNGHARRIPLSREAVCLLRARLKREADPVFPLSANAFRLAWGRVTKRANLDNLHFHDLRHEAISRLFEKGLTIPEAAMISGHKDARMLFRYAHANQKSILTKLDKSKF